MERHGTSAEERNALLAEYDACISTAHHLDTMNSNMAALFLGGSLAALGFVLQRTDFVKLLPVLAFLSTVIMLGWAVIVIRADGLTEICFIRMEEIENQMDMHLQHYFSQYRNAPTHKLLWRHAVVGGRTHNLFRLKTLHIFGGILSIYLAALWLYAFCLFYLSSACKI